MHVELYREPHIPADVLKLLATPVARSRQTWYLAAGAQDAASARHWCVATVWNEAPGGDDARWGIALRGAAEPSLVQLLADGLAATARTCGCAVLSSAALEVGSAFDLLLQQAGFGPTRSYRFVGTSTYAAQRALGLGVRGADLEAAGWQVAPPSERELPLLHAMFLHELGHIPPHWLHLAEDPAAARAMDQSLVLRRHGKVVGALAARLIGSVIDVQALVCHPRWRQHRALSWLLAQCTAGWVLHARELIFSYPLDNPGIADIARRIEAQTISARHDLARRVTP
ncbi:MAG: hypothetical protein K0R43_4132 [Pseudoduganella sp.]|jgi:hypothetical protein|nr:hypothetical protein [Pseudoduganella sp.]